jgi:hypothetical protein
MTETQATAATTAPPGPIERFEERIAGHAEAEAADLSAALKTTLQDHAGAVLDVSADFLKIVAVLDPADATATAAMSALVPRVLAMASSAAQLASTALKGHTT